MGYDRKDVRKTTGRTLTIFGIISCKDDQMIRCVQANQSRMKPMSIIEYFTKMSG